MFCRHIKSSLLACMRQPPFTSLEIKTASLFIKFMEKNLQKQCIEYARSKNLMIYSINPPSFKRMTYGTLMQMPDLHIVDYNAYFELKDYKYTKAHKERQEKQAKRRRELVLHNAKAYKVNTLEKFIKILEFLNDKQKSTSK